MIKNKPAILVVDDDGELLHSVRAVLVKHGMKADSAQNGCDALRKIRKNSYDLVLCDINMPGMTGLEFLEKLRNAGQDIDVVLMTGYLEPKYFSKALRLGATDFISKPFDSHELVKVIFEIVEKNNSDENSRKFLQHIEEVQMNFVINPSSYSQHGLINICTQFLQQSIHMTQNELNELLICVDEMLHNAFIHGTLGLTAQQRKYAKLDLDQLINHKLNQPHISSRRIRFSMTVYGAEKQVVLSVEDDGDGFDHQNWIQNVEKAEVFSLEENGRGLAVLRHLSHTMDFDNGGRKIRVTRKLTTDQISEA